MMNITNPIITEYLTSHYEPLNRQMAAFRKVGEDNNVPIIQKETEQLLNVLLAVIKPKNILEIGTAIGYSACYFATACPEAQVYTVEKDEYAFRAALQNVKAAKLESQVHCFFGDGQEQIEKMGDQKIAPIDFVFIDAAKSHYRRFLEAALNICNEKALIVSDNVLQRGTTASDQYDPKRKHITNIRKMRDYVDFLHRDEEFTSTVLAVGDGVAISLFEKKHE